MTDDTPKPLKEMTDAEIGALVRAHKEGKAIETCYPGWARTEWVYCDPQWSWDWAYRIRSEPVRETVTLTGGAVYEWRFSHHEVRADTHRITFDLIDGKPDLTSIRMEELR